MLQLGRFFAGAWIDLRGALRHLRSAPAFHVAAILVIAIGTGANLTLFGLFDNLALRRLPVPAPERLVSFDAADPTQPDQLPTVLPMEALGRFEELNSVFSSVASIARAGLTLETRVGFAQEGVAFVSGRYFDVLEVRPALGRLINSNDVETSARVAVMTNDYWQRHFSGDPRIVGTEVKLQGLPFSVIGVAEPGFTGLNVDYVTAFVVPATTAPLVEQALGGPGSGPIPMEYGIGRLRPGMDLVRARTQLQDLWPGIREAIAPPGASQSRTAFLTLRLDVNTARHGFSLMREWWARPLNVLIAATILLLLIACINLAALVTARTLESRSEFITRSALGAPRWRLAQEQFVHSGLMTLFGVVVGVELARFAVKAIGPALFYWQTDNVQSITLRSDWPIAIVVVASLIGVGVAVGMIPAISVSDSRLHESLHHGRSTAIAVSRWSSRLLVLQVSGAALLLICAGVFSKSLGQLRRADAGLTVANVFVVNLASQPGRDRSADPVAYSTRLLQRLEQVSGVRSAAFSNVAPMMGLGVAEVRAAVALANAPPEVRGLRATTVSVSPQFFSTLGITLLGGRDFAWTDDRARPQVAVVSKALAAQLFGNDYPLGQHIRIGASPRLRDVVVIGITDDVRLTDLHSQSPVFLYRPLLQGATIGAQSPSSIVIRADGVQVSSLQPLVRSVIESLGQDFVVEQKTLSDQIDRSLVRDRLLALGANIFAGAATALVVLGLCGVIGLTVSARTREIGIRAALGADSRALRRMVLWSAARLASLGLAIGLPAGWLASRFGAGELVAVSPQDPMIFLLTALTIMVVSLISAWVPASRAAAVQPMQAVRFG